MAWSDTKQAAVDPDNPAANEQIPFSEWNNMVTYLKDKIINKTVDDSALGNDKILVYKTATSTFVFESQSAIAALDDIPDVTISGVPADNEVLAYDSGTSEWINQTAAEAGLATTTDLASYLLLAGGTMAGNLNMGDSQINGLDDIQAYDLAGILCRDSAAASKLTIATTTNAFIAYAEASMNSNKLVSVSDPTAAQDASTKNYDDTHLFAKEAVTSFTDGYIPVYRTSSGKFEMEAGGGSAGLPVADTTPIVKGSVDGTKLVRFEVDGLTTGNTRVITVPDKDLTLAGAWTDLPDTPSSITSYGLPAANAAGDAFIDTEFRININKLYLSNELHGLYMRGGPSEYSSYIELEGMASVNDPGQTNFYQYYTTSSVVLAAYIDGETATPKVHIMQGLDMEDNAITDMKNSAASALSGTQLDIEIDIGGVPYYFTVYPTKA